jgi:hypothetical protein
MNYAYISAKKEDQKPALQQAVNELNRRTGLDAKLCSDLSVELKPGLILPVFPEETRLGLLSVEEHILAGNPQWKEYQQKMASGVDKAITYIGVLFKALLCQALNQNLEDDGAGEYRENPNDPKLKTLDAWKKHIRSFDRGILINTLNKLQRGSADKIDAKFFPELKRREIPSPEL